MFRTAARAPRLLLALSCATLLAPGCSSPSKSTDVDHVAIREAAIRAPWTSAFEIPSGVIADVIEIEGPPALIDHFVARQDPALVEYRTELTPEGMLHVYRRKNVHPIVEITAQLDNWELSAFVELRVLFAVDERAVRLRAQGGVTVAQYGGTGVERTESYERVGDPRAEAAARAARADLEAAESVEPQEAAGDGPQGDGPQGDGPQSDGPQEEGPPAEPRAEAGNGS